MADLYPGATSVDGSSGLTPEEYFGQVKQMYPSAVFTSGYRSPQYNSAVGGVPNSMHLSGQAMDFQVPGVPSEQVFNRLHNAGLPMTESLNEGNHLHVGWAPKGGQTPGPLYPGAVDVHPSAQPAHSSNNNPYPGAVDVQQQPQHSLFDAVSETVHNASDNFGLYFNSEVQSQVVAPWVKAYKSNQPYQAPPVHNPWDVVRGLAGQTAHDTQGLKDFAGAVMNTPIGAMMHAAVIRPLAEAGSNIPMGAQVGSSTPPNKQQREQILEGHLGMATMGIGPEFGGADVAGMASASLMDAVRAQALKAKLQVPGGAPPSDFTASLFAQRGKDTLPPETPTGVTRPITQGAVRLNPQEATQYHNLLNTGNVDQIMDFFKERQGLAPTYTDVQNWVNHRDSTTVHDPMQDTHLQPELNYKEDQRQAVEAHINQLTSGWKNPPNYEVVHGPEDINDPAIRAQAMAEDTDGRALGMLGPDGKARIFSGRINNPDTATAVAFHEGLGHHGLEQAFGDKLDSTLEALLGRNVNQFSKDVDAYQKENPDTYGGDRIRAAEEVLAQRSESGQLKPAWQDALMSIVRQFGRKMGMNLGYSDAEVRQVLAMAHDAVINGNGRNVAANGFRGALLSQPTPSRFMMRPKDALSEPTRDYTGALQETEDAYTKYIQEDQQHLSDAEITRRAQDLGFKPSQIRDLGNIGDLSTRVARVGGALTMAKSRLADLNTKIDTPDWSVRDADNYRQVLADFNYQMTKYLGTTEELGRALRMVNVIGHTREALGNVSDVLKEMGNGFGDDENLLKFARKLKGVMDNGEDAQADSLLKGSRNPSIWQYLNTVWHNSMLSGLSTHFKATLDMMTGIGLNTQERLLAMPVGQVRQMLINMTGEKPLPSIHPSEVAGDIMGTLHAVFDTEVHQATLRALKTGNGSVQLPGGQNIDMNQNSFGTQGNPRIPIVSIPTDLIAAQDTALRSTAVSQQLYALGNRKALADLKAQGNPNPSMDDIMTLGRTYAHNPDQAMLDEAMDLGSRTVLMNSNPLNRFIDKARVITPGMSQLQQARAFLVGFLTPFIRVESNNLINRFIQRSPLGLIDPTGYTWQQLKAGGPQADLAMSRMMYGTAKMALYWALADKGVNLVKSAYQSVFGQKQLTGQLSDNPDKRKELEAAGERPNSVDENGRFNSADGLNASLNPFDVHNNTAQLVASARHTFDEGVNKGQMGIAFRLALGGVFHDIAQQSWVHDTAPIIDDMMTTDGTAMYKTNKLVSDMASNFSPNILNQTARWIDPQRRETITTQGNFGGMGQSVLNTLKARTPGLSQTLPPAESVYGEPLANGASLTGVHTWLHHGNGVEAATDPTIVEMNRLANLSPAAIVTPVQKTVPVYDTNGDPQVDDNGKTITRKLSNREYSEYQRVAGQSIVNKVREAMQSPDWSIMSDKDKIQAIRDIQKDSKQEARDSLYGPTQ